MSCINDGIKDVSDFFSGIFTSEETQAVMKPVLSPAIDILQTATNVPETVYTVQSGDTLAKIGKAHNVDYHEIAKANGITNPNDIAVGQELKIPNSTKAPVQMPATEPKPTKNPVSDETSMCNGKEDGCEKCEFDWAKTPIVKLIISKESKGSYNAYNITGWNSRGKNKVFESHFSPTRQYNITHMTIKQIQTAQTKLQGKYKKHLFAVGLYQCIPKTLNSFISWFKKYQTSTTSTQLFDKNFQDKLPWYFWEKKRPIISQYFKGSTSVEAAAYEVSKEWASAGTPKGYKIRSGKISNGVMSYYGGDGLNKAHYSALKTIHALKETKKMLDECDGYNKIRNKLLK